MCFRPNEAHNGNWAGKEGYCPNCGLLVAAEDGVTCGECPYCHEFIPEEPSAMPGNMDPGDNARIL